MFNIFWYILTTVIIIHKEVDGLQCYSCNSHDDSRCGWDKLPDSMLKNCTALQHGDQNNMCRKIVQVIEFEVNGLPPERRVIRSCGREETGTKGACYRRSGFGGTQRVCSCPGDSCNSSTRMTPGLCIAFILTLLFIKLA